MNTLANEGAIGRSEVHALTATDWALLIARLALGIVFFVHGSQKVLGLFGGPGLSGFVGGMAKGGIPVPLAYLAAFTEFFGSLALIFGVLARLAAAGITVVMLVAIFHVHIQNGFFMNWYSKPGQGEGFEYHILAIALCLAVIIAGPGRIAFADLEARFLNRPK